MSRESSVSLPRQAFNVTVKPVFLAVRGAANRVLDRRWGIRTLGEVELAALGLHEDQGNRYKPSEWRTLSRILPRAEVGPDDVFIDIGSGLGRVVFQAARYPFRRVVGVELSDRLNEVARDNIERNRHRLRCNDVQLVTADARVYEIPDDVTVVFMANPFTGELFRAVVDAVLASVERSPRRLRLIYRNPIEHELLTATGRFQVVRQLRGWRPGKEWSRSNATRMYELVGR